jgi:hypothetical protein
VPFFGLLFKAHSFDTPQLDGEAGNSLFTIPDERDNPAIVGRMGTACAL